MALTTGLRVLGQAIIFVLDSTDRLRMCVAKVRRGGPPTHGDDPRIHNLFFLKRQGDDTTIA
jgi:hypothetical protein